jgi:hypothetical protein
MAYRPVDVEILEDSVDEDVKEEHELKMDVGLVHGGVHLIDLVQHLVEILHEMPRSRKRRRRRGVERAHSAHLGMLRHCRRHSRCRRGSSPLAGRRVFG